MLRSLMSKDSVSNRSVGVGERCVAPSKVAAVVLTTQLVAYRSPIVVGSADSKANSDGLT